MFLVPLLLASSPVVAVFDIEDTASGLKAESYNSCYEKACQIEVGREVAAQKSLLTKIGKLGKRCVFTSTLYDLKIAASERGASEVTDCKPETFLGAIDRVAVELRADAPPSASLGSERVSPILSERSVVGGLSFFKIAGLAHGDTQHVARALFGVPMKSERIDDHGGVRDTFREGFSVDYRRDRVVAVSFASVEAARAIRETSGDPKLALAGASLSELRGLLGEPDLEYLNGQVVRFKLKDGVRRADLVLSCYDRDDFACSGIEVQFSY